MDIESSLAGYTRPYNRMLFIERGAKSEYYYLHGFIEGKKVENDVIDATGIGDKPIVFWLAKHFNHREIDKAWVESKGQRNDLEFRRIFRPHRRYQKDRPKSADPDSDSEQPLQTTTIAVEQLEL